MSRPTKDEVDDALGCVDIESCRNDAVGVLAAEVIALREELAAANAACVTSVERSGVLGEALRRAEALVMAPRYSTEAVDAAIAVYDRYCMHDMSVDEYDLGKSLEAVRASREPKRCKGCNFEGSCYWMWDAQRKCCPDCTCVAP